MSRAELFAICEGYWRATTFTPAAYAAYVRAKNELTRGDASMIPWCRSLLQHDAYEARATGAFLLGTLGERGLLGELTTEIISELGALARRPWVSDAKESEASSAAISALGNLGHRAAIAELRPLLASSGPNIPTDRAWDAAEAIAQLVGADFGPDPVRGANEWLLRNKDQA